MRIIILFVTALIAWPHAGSGQELISDPGFQRGVNVKHPATGEFQGTLVWDQTLPPPIWDCVQWNSISSIVGAPVDSPAPDWFRWENTEKSVEMGQSGATVFDLLLGVDSVSEYGGVYRTVSDPWPAFLLEQRLSEPGTQGPGCPPLSDLVSLDFRMDARLTLAEIIVVAGYDANIHASQYSVYFIVQNLNPASSGYGKLLWLGVPVYDDRYEMTPLYVALDVATGSMIYRIAQQDVAPVSLHDGTWVSYSVDLLPYAMAALQEVWSRGYLTESTDFADYRIGGLNLGWEVPGLSRVAITIRNLSLVADLSGISGVASDDMGTPKLQVLPNYPNPFNPTTTIPLFLDKGASVRLTICNIRGEVVRVLHDGFLDAGRHSFVWHGVDHGNAPVGSGLYHAIIQADGQGQAARKMILLK